VVYPVPLPLSTLFLVMHSDEEEGAFGLPRRWSPSERIQTGVALDVPLKNVLGADTTPASFVESKPITVIVFFRRFGCALCRHHAKGFSDMKSDFDAAGVQIIGVGFDKENISGFLRGGYWKFPLLVAPSRSHYKDIGFKRGSLIDILRPSTFAAYKKASKEGVSGNFTKGDGFQLGGQLIFDKTKALLASFLQKHAADNSTAADTLLVCSTLLSGGVSVREKAATKL